MDLIFHIAKSKIGLQYMNVHKILAPDTNKPERERLRELLKDKFITVITMVGLRPMIKTWPEE